MLRISKHSGVYTLEAEQYLPISIEKAWDFFSSPGNLTNITPPHMGFQITSKEEESMYPGQIISYRIGLLPGIKSNWVTEITHVSEGKYFVDEQRFGPYRMWHHEHHLEAAEAGTRMYDKISYKIPMGLLGHLMHGLFIKSQLKKIFDFRYKTLERLFGEYVKEEMEVQ